MKRHEYNFELWCRSATILIRYKPDRTAVHKELRAHLDDIFEAAIAKGLTEEEAEAKALESMGKAHDIAPQLAAIHKPFWGLVIQVSQIALVILLVLSLIPIWKYACSLNIYDAPHVQSFEVYESASYGEGTDRVLHHLSEPGVSFSSEAGKFTVTNAAVFTTFSDDGKKSNTQLYMLVEQRSWLPWKEHKGYFQFDPVTQWFSARDSLGNVYDCVWDKPFESSGRMRSSAVQSGIFTGTHELLINSFPQDAQWVEILYTRDGREYVLRIDLTGGDRT